jgi:MFS family permease
VVNAYVLALTALVAFGGKLGDRVGGVRTFRIGVAGFFVASALCGLTPAGGLGEAWIIAARALQGAAAALMVPTSGAIVISAFPVQERGRAMAAYAGISQIFLAIGPLIGGALTESVSWRAVFWLNVPVGIAALVLVAIAKPAQATRPGRIRAGALALLVGGLGATVLAVQEASTWGWDAPLTLILLGAGVGPPRRSSSRSPASPTRSSTSVCCVADPSWPTSRSTASCSSGCWPRCCTARSTCRTSCTSRRSRPGSPCWRWFCRSPWRPSSAGGGSTGPGYDRPCWPG